MKHSAAVLLLCLSLACTKTIHEPLNPDPFPDLKVNEVQIEEFFLYNGEIAARSYYWRSANMSIWYFEYEESGPYMPYDMTGGGVITLRTHGRGYIRTLYWRVA